MLQYATLLLLVTAPLAADEPSPAAPLMKLLQSGRLPPERVGTVVEMICQKGNGKDLAYILHKLETTGALTPEVRLKTVELLIDAAVVRKVKPEGDLSKSTMNILAAGKGDARFGLAVIKLASVWKVKGISILLNTLASDERSGPTLRAAAIEGLATVGDEWSKSSLLEISAKDKSMSVRIMAASGLARIDLDEGVKQAAGIFSAASAKDDPGPLLDAILSRKEGAEKLAAALANVKLEQEVAKVTLRYMYSIGRSDAELSNLLSKEADIALDAPPPSQEEVQKIAAEVMAKGNPARGERVFRRADVNCLKCHAIARAGGQVGPELTALGSISPPEYIVNSVLNPSLNIKEQYVTKVFLTVDGEVVTGIIVDRNDERVRLKDASGKLVTLAVADIEAEKEGPSLMPQGLTKFLTHDEFLDLARFITELGRPGPYAIRTMPTIQRWRLLKSPPPELTEGIPNVEQIRILILDALPDAFVPLYGTAGGTLPMEDIRAMLRSDGASAKTIAWLQGEIDVSAAGNIELEVTSPVPAHLWLDAEPFEKPTKLDLPLAAGRHKLTLRLDLSSGSATAADASLKVELLKPAGSSVQFDVVGGQ